MGAGGGEEKTHNKKPQQFIEKNDTWGESKIIRPASPLIVLYCVGSLPAPLGSSFFPNCFLHSHICYRKHYDFGEVL